jgi:hypothetical protein
MRVQADAGKRELDHVGLAEDDGASAPQPGYDWRVGFRRRRAREKLLAGRGRLAGHVEEVLD